MISTNQNLFESGNFFGFLRYHQVIDKLKESVNRVESLKQIALKTSLNNRRMWKKYNYSVTICVELLQYSKNPYISDSRL